MRTTRLALGLVLAALSGPALAQDVPPWFAAIKAAYNKPVKSPKDLPALPPVQARFPAAEWDYGVFKFNWNGVSIVYDPVNNEALFLCGHNGGMPFGTMGSWALAEDGKTWRELKFASALLDPLRGKALVARQLAKQCEAAARNIYYSGRTAAKEAEAVKGVPARLAASAIQSAEELATALDAASATGWEKEAVARAKGLVEKSLAAGRMARDGFLAGQLDAALLKQAFTAQWALEEAADCLASSPKPRENASAALDPERRCVVLFGGSHHDYMVNDTWIYDCSRQSWRQVWPTTAPTARMSANFYWAPEKDALVLSGGQTVLNKMVYQQGEMPAPAGEWTFDTRRGEWTGQGGAASGTRIYRSIVPGYDPCWYDAAPRGDAKATEEWLAQVPPNVWTAVPAQPAPAPERDWGTAVFDPDRNQIYRWTGGHCADPASQPSTYHPGLNRWSIPFVPDIILARKGMTFSGRPDCANHTYLHYAYDPVSKRLICPSMGGTGVFNPDLGDFEFSVDQPFNRHIYETCSAGTPQGVVLWSQGGAMFRFDYKERAWMKFPVSGKGPAPQCDGSAMCYDAKRDALWLASFLSYQKASGNLWRCDLKTGQVQAMNPANAASIGLAKGFNSEIRESVYVPTADLVLFNNFVAGQEVAYDPVKNRWVTLNIRKNLERLGTVSDTLVWDPKRALVWNLNSYKAIYVLRIEPKALVLSDEPLK
jgi:hypothetical protein